MDDHHLGLTERGKRDAQDFGELLHEYQAVRLYHSPARRCRETAQAIGMGVERIGIDVITAEEDKELNWTTCVLNDHCLLMVERLGHDFIREWFSGKVDRNLIKSAAVTSSEMATHMVQRLAEDGRSGLLDINISHDWNILTLRENYLNLRHEDMGWIGYLDGLALYPLDGSISLAYGPVNKPLQPARDDLPIDRS